MAGLTSGPEAYHVTLTTADGIEIGLVSVADEKSGRHVFDGVLTPVDATEQFRPGGIPREWNDFSAGGGYSFYDERAPTGYAWAKNVWTLIPHVALPSGELTEVAIQVGSHGEIRAGVEAGGHLYVSTGRYVCKVSDGSASQATIVQDFTALAGVGGAVVTTSVTTYLGDLFWGSYAGTSAQPLVRHVVSSDTFTSGATCARWQVASFGGLDGNGTWSEWLVGTTGTGSSFKYTNSASPLSETNWTPGTAKEFGNRSNPVTNIVSSRQAPYFLKPEGIFSIQRLGVSIPNITPHWADTYNAQNGANAVLVGGRLYASLLGGIDMVVGLDGQLNDTPYLVHPGADLPNETPVAGECTAMARDGDWLIAAIYNSVTGNSYVCWGKPRENLPGQPGITRFIWHMAPLVIEGERVTWLKKASTGTFPTVDQRLWVATRDSDNSTTKLYWMSLPRTGNVLQDLLNGGTWRGRTDECTLYLPSNPWSQGVHSLKAIRQVAVVSESASESSYLTINAEADEDAAVQLGATVTESPYTEARIVEDISGRQIRPSVEFKAGADTAMPILRALTIWSGEGIRAATVYTGRFRLSQGVRLRNGTIDTTTNPQATWELLVGAQGPRPCTMVDWKGTVYTIALEQGSVWMEREVKNSEHWEIEAKIQFTVLSRQPTYNDGSVFDSDASFVD